jgi:gliding motility-associated-like protein
MLKYITAQASTNCQGLQLRLLVLFMIIWNYSNGQTSCQPPFGTVTASINDSTISITWRFLLTSTRESLYDAEYREFNSGTWTKAFFPYGNNGEYCWLTNLKRGKCYDWRVRGICISSTGTSDTTIWTTGIVNNGAASCSSAPPNPPGPSPSVNPSFSFSPDPCFPGRVSFSNNSTASGTTIRSVEWNLGDNNKSTSDNPVHIYQKTGSYEVTLIVTDDSGKIYTRKTIVAIPALITRFANAGSDREICKAETITLQASGGESYSWSPCTRLSNCRIPNPTVVPGTIGSYIVSVTNKDGCIDTDTVLVKYVDPAIMLYVPDAFTPNNDGINDQFRPLISLQGQVDAEWKLFNRFGNMIFSTNSSTAGWDGKYKGQPQPPGNFTYMITIKATGGCPARNMKGTVLLIR